MNRAKFAYGRIRELGIGREEKALKPRVRSIRVAGAPFAVGTNFEERGSRAEKIADRAAHNRGKMLAKQVREPQISPYDTPFTVMHQNGVTNGIEGINPLLLNGLDLFEQIY